MRVNRIVDLSVPLGPGTVVYPGDPVPSFRPHSTIAGEGFNLLEVRIGSQTGTHVDAPRHFVDGASVIDDLDLHRFVGRGVVVNAIGLPPRGRITSAHVAPVLDQLGPDCIVLCRTDWGEHYGSPVWFDHPFLDAEACGSILEAGVRTILMDVMNIDETPDEGHPGEGFPCHHLIAAVDGVIGENMTNFSAIDWPDPLISCLPLRMQDADGAPVRAVAIQLIP